MDDARLRRLLTDVASGAVAVEDAADTLRRLPFEDLGFARVDHHRALRGPGPEVVFAPGKPTDAVVGICRALVAEGGVPVLVTRASADQAAAVCGAFPGTVWEESARLLVLRPAPPGSLPGTVAVVAAGTADLPVAEEAAATVAAYGAGVERIADVGVAGPHRLLAESERLRRADVAIVVAGMEGALPSLVGGLIGAPVVAVPTSVGYGAAFGGLAALLGMLTSCAAGLVVVNIDNGFGAAVHAVRVLAGRVGSPP